MTVVVTLLAVVVTVLAFLVAGLLRSHAAILRRLHEAGIDLDGVSLPVVSSDPEQPSAASDPPTPRPNDAATGRSAADVGGVTPTGDPFTIGVVDRRHDTSLLFLSADCATCEPFWEAVGDGRAAAVSTPDHRLVVVTRDPADDLAGAIAQRRSDVPVIMSSRAWQDYEVPGSPYVVQVDGATGRVTGEGTSADWDQLQALAERGRAEASAPRNRRRRRGSDRPARDSDDELRAVGIRPGDPSLYPNDPTGGT